MSKRANGEGSIFYQEGRKRWAAFITIGHNPETGKQVKKFVYAKTQQEVRIKKQALEAKFGNIKFIDADKITVAQWLEKWLNVYIEKSVRPETAESYRTIVRAYLIPKLGNCRLMKLTAPDIQQAINAIIEDGKSARTAEYALTVLKMSIKRAISTELIVRDVSIGVKKPKKTKKAIRILTADEIKTMFNIAAQKDLSLFTAMIWNTGLRREEALGLKWSSVDFAHKTITIENTVVNVDKQVKLQPLVKQPHSLRKVTLPQQLVDLLKQHKKKQAEHKLAARVYLDHDLVLCREDGQPYSPRYYTKKFTDIMTSGGLTGISPHILRHNHATTLFAAGWHPKDIQERLGHASVTITLDIYTHHVPARQNEIATFLENAYPCIPT